VPTPSVHDVRINVCPHPSLATHVLTTGAPRDYCGIPIISLATEPKRLSGGYNRSATNLQACIGACDTDAHCAPGLKCFQREKGETIPGCIGNGPNLQADYCYDRGCDASFGPGPGSTNGSQARTCHSTYVLFARMFVCVRMPACWCLQCASGWGWGCCE